MRLADLFTSSFGRALFLPAHGRGDALPREIRYMLSKKPGLWDLPELPEIGGPTEAFGAIKRSQEKAARLFGADRCWFGVNGATGLLQAALFSLVKPGQAVLIPRNAHKSIFHACLIGGFVPVLFDLPFDSRSGNYLPPTQEWILRVLDHPLVKSSDIASVVLVNPTYNGYSSNLSKLIETIHKKELPVLVDEAHGTHFCLSEENSLPISALNSGADLVVNSLHKSSVGLAQTAVLWSQGLLVNSDSIEESLNWFQTSSPSSLLLASCESALKQFYSKKGRKKIKDCIQNARKLSFYLRENGIPLIDNDDPLKLILHASNSGFTGFEVDEYFIKHGIVGELPEIGTLTLCLGFSNHKGLDKSLIRNWNMLMKTKSNNKILYEHSHVPVPLVSIPNISLINSKYVQTKRLLLEEAEDQISAEIIAPYPPGIPVLIPGEKLDNKRLKWMIDQNTMSPNLFPSYLKVIEKS
tara:strand:- start:2 stop:1405 length:1404 start_codon:yes stop_codon:yes gene_type:complete